MLCLVTESLGEQRVYLHTRITFISVFFYQMTSPTHSTHQQLSLYIKQLSGMLSMEVP